MKNILSLLFAALFLFSCQWNTLKLFSNIYVSSSEEPVFHWRAKAEVPAEIIQAKAIVDPFEIDSYKERAQLLGLIAAKVNQRLADRGLIITPYQYPLINTSNTEFSLYPVQEERDFVGADLPLVHFGGFDRSSDDEDTAFAKNILSVRRGSPKWQSNYVVTHEAKPSLYIYVGKLQTAGRVVNGKKVIQVADDKFIEINKRAYISEPLNVIALKAVHLNERGLPIASAVHGIIPLWPDNNELSVTNFLNNSSGYGSLVYDVSDVGSLDQYDIDGATDSLLSTLGYNDVAHQP